MENLINIDLNDKEMKWLDVKSGGFYRIKNYDFGLSEYQNRKFSRVVYLISIIPKAKRHNVLIEFLGTIDDNSGNPMQAWFKVLRGQISNDIIIDNAIMERKQEIQTEFKNDQLQGKYFWTCYSNPLNELLGRAKFKELKLEY